MDYAKTTLRNVEDMAAKHGLSDNQEARFPRQEVGAEQTGMNYLIVKPGRREAFAHRHRTAEEIYVVLAGSGNGKVDEDWLELAPLEAVGGGHEVRQSSKTCASGRDDLSFGRTC